eukprot:UN02287
MIVLLISIHPLLYSLGLYNILILSTTSFISLFCTLLCFCSLFCFPCLSVVSLCFQIIKIYYS